MKIYHGDGFERVAFSGNWFVEAATDQNIRCVKTGIYDVWLSTSGYISFGLWE